MEVVIKLKEWRYKVDEETKEGKICGTYTINAGPAELATQPFNEGYQSVKVPFSNELKAYIESMTEKIASEIKKHFTGKE